MLWVKYGWKITYYPLFNYGNNPGKIDRVLQELNRANYILYRENDQYSLLETTEEEPYMKLVEQLREDIDAGRLRLLKTFSLEGKTVHLYEKLVN